MAGLSYTIDIVPARIGSMSRYSGAKAIY
jgi:hypothetical protein